MTSSADEPRSIAMRFDRTYDAREVSQVAAVEGRSLSLEHQPREPFRRSVIEPVCIAQFKGKGLPSYIETFDHPVSLLQARSNSATPLGSLQRTDENFCIDNG